jgi:peptidoglycan hydrolase-like protein with peptidoglycan-binding domain
MNNGLKWALVSLPILVGGFIVYRTLTREKREEKKRMKEQGVGGGLPPTTPTIVPTTTTTSGSTPTVKPDFPIGIGSRGAKVIELQQAIVNDGQPNIVSLLGSNPTDGKFGTGTEKAVKALLGKTKIDSQADIDKIKGLSAARVSSALQTAGKNDRIALANKLISLFKQNPATRKFYAIQDLGGSIYKVTTDGREILESSKVWKKGEAIGPTRSGLSRNAKFVVNSSGFIQAYDGSLMVYFSPYGVEVK